MFDELVDRDITLWVRVVEEFFFSGVSVCGVDVSELAQTVGRTILQHVDDTTGTNMLTTCTLVTTVSEFGVELDREILSNLYVGLEVDIGTANARTKDNTLVFTLSQ